MTRAGHAAAPPSSLAAWREAAGLSPRMAARHLRISVETYEGYERGLGECPASLAMDIFQRTQGAVLPGDLPGCDETVAGRCGSAGDVDAAVSCDGDAASPGAGGAPPAPPAPACRAGSRPRAFVQGGGVVLALEDDGELVPLTPGAAGELGLQLIRSALAAVR